MREGDAEERFPIHNFGTLKKKKRVAPLWDRRKGGRQKKKNEIETRSKFNALINQSVDKPKKKNAKKRHYI